MTSSAEVESLAPILPEAVPAETPPRLRLWLWLPLILAGGLACGWQMPRWSATESDAPDPFAALDDSDTIFLGDSASLTGQDSGLAAANSSAAEPLELPVLPGWNDVANVDVAQTESDQTAPQWAAYETATPAAADLSRPPAAPVWLDGTIEFFAADDESLRPLRQAFGPTSYQR